MDDAKWTLLVRRLKNGDCTPFLGAGACIPTLPTSADLSESLAKEYDYPFLDRTNLSRVTHYAASLSDHSTVKERVAEMIRAAGYPAFTSDTEPHALLAELPLPVYLTTNYDDFMVRALEATKTPRPAVCPWYRLEPPDAQIQADLDFVPSAKQPIVYHLHGSCKENVQSLVLTEEDYLEYLLWLTGGHGGHNQILIPKSINESLMKPLLFIGYSLHDWTFLLILHGLRRTVARTHHQLNVSVQLLPDTNSDPGSLVRAETYLNAYFDKVFDLSVFWGSSENFCTELRGRL